MSDRYRFFVALLGWVAFVPAWAQVPQALGTTYASSFGAAATIHPKATQAAGQVLENGGNAIDAAIAATLTLGVVDGFNSGLGGGLFALVRYADGEIQAIDAREQAPADATEDLFIRDGQAVKSLSRTGALAVGVPGSVLALEQLHQRGGKLPLAVHYLKAAVLAEQGFPLTAHYAARIARTQEDLQQFPQSASIFLDPNGQAWPAGHVLKQPDLARSYLQIADQGSQWFYHGEFAQKAEQWMQANGGVIQASDFADYQLKIREPVVRTFAGFEFVGFPPPSSGGIHVAQMLDMLQRLGFKDLNAAQQAHWLAEVMKLAFADRSRWLG
ncbi:MAG: gamma-glutamyltransferase, partial [Limnobacter sp.]|nr:gamma-glutamyltransferase [Limnobacter sp.]